MADLVYHMGFGPLNILLILSIEGQLMLILGKRSYITYAVLLVGYVPFKKCKILENKEQNWQIFLQIKNIWINFWLRQWTAQLQNVHFNGSKQKV